MRNKLILLLSLLVLSAGAQAQVLLSSKPTYDISMLTHPVVEKELTLTAEQKPQFEKLMKEMSSQRIEISGGSEDEMRAQLKEFSDNFDKKVLDGVKAILDEKQLERFHQLNRQRMGIDALTFEDTKKAMGYSPETLKKLTTLAGDYNGEHAELMHSLAKIDGGNQEIQIIGPKEMKEIRALRDKFYKKALELLSETEKAKWAELTGPAVDFGDN